MARFVGRDRPMGRKILLEPRYAQYRPWLGSEVQVEIGTADLVPHSATDTRVQITLPWGETAMVRTAMLVGLIAKDLEEIYLIALDKRYPTTGTTVGTTVTTA